MYNLYQNYLGTHQFLVWLIYVSVARAFLGGQIAHSVGQIVEEIVENLKKSEKNWCIFEEKLEKVEYLPTWDCEAGYGTVEVSMLVSAAGWDSALGLLAPLHPWDSGLLSLHNAISYICLR